MVHQTVLRTEAIAALSIKQNGIYVDATFGRGGHAALILSHLGPQGKLIVCDQDVSAIEAAKKQWGSDSRVTILHDNFGRLDQHLQDFWGKIDGILFDLGVSSPQLDEAERGFSFLREGPLDMRMDQSRGSPVSERLKTVSAEELTRILRDYGEEKFAFKISHKILEAQPQTTQALANLIPDYSHDHHKHPATRTFQALRIWINEELASLESVLLFLPDILAIGGRAAFISFHSLEDRQVKERMRLLTSPPYHPRGLPIQADTQDSPSMRICIKMQKPSENEIKQNPRARSAVLRVMERVR